MTSPPSRAERPPVALTVAGSDSSGSSGIQADLPTFAANGAHGATVVTVVTAQDTHGVKQVFPLPVEFVEAQLLVVADDLAPGATKTGMLWSAEVIGVVGSAAAEGRLGAMVVDPVLVDSAGRRLVDETVIDAYLRLARTATLFTPNRWEAEILVGRALVDTAAVVDAAPVLASLGAEVVVVTGGRSEGTTVSDVVITASGVEVVGAPRVGSDVVRGTGCTFSAAAAAHLARGAAPLEAVSSARAFVLGQLRRIRELHPGGGRAGVPHRFDVLAESE